MAAARNLTPSLQTTLPPALRAVLFGAFDRHNFGDMLFPHLLAASLPGRAFTFAGLARRDLAAHGGHRVRPLATLADPLPTHLIHAGGELLTCSAYQAAIMLLDPQAAAAAIERYDADPDAAARWAGHTLGCARHMPYVAGRAAVAPGGRLIFNAVGGVDWSALSADARAEVKTALQAADWLSVRDHRTRAALRAEGVDAPLCPDPAVMVRADCGDVVAAHRSRPPLQAMAQAFPQGWLACQFSAEFGDDASLDTLARALSAAVAETGLGLALFRAGAAPWHDDPAVYARLQARLPAGAARRFESLHLWDICALIAASRGVVGSSLHARIVALAYGLPRVSLIPPQQDGHPCKTAAFAETWEPDAVPRVVALPQLGDAVRQALDLPADLLQDNARALCERYRESLAQWVGMLPCRARSGSGPRQ